MRAHKPVWFYTVGFTLSPAFRHYCSMSSALAFWRWPRRRWFRILWCLLAVGLLVALPVMIIEFKKSNWSVKYQAWFISGMFVLMALPVSIYEVAMHLEYFSRPKLQIRVIRILWMVPVYAVDSWFALRFKVSVVHTFQNIFCNTQRVGETSSNSDIRFCTTKQHISLTE